VLGQAWHDLSVIVPLRVCVRCMQMPVMNGFDSTRNIRTFNFSVPIVAVSASLDDSEREACLAMGMTDVLMKPVVSSKLMAVVKALTPPSSVC
jgi:CheY-like chemotaxis protein